MQEPKFKKGDTVFVDLVGTIAGVSEGEPQKYTVLSGKNVIVDVPEGDMLPAEEEI